MKGHAIGAAILVLATALLFAQADAHPSNHNKQTEKSRSHNQYDWWTRILRRLHRNYGERRPWWWHPYRPPPRPTTQPPRPYPTTTTAASVRTISTSSAISTSITTRSSASSGSISTKTTSSSSSTPPGTSTVSRTLTALTTVLATTTIVPDTTTTRTSTSTSSGTSSGTSTRISSSTSSRTTTSTTTGSTSTTTRTTTTTTTSTTTRTTTFTTATTSTPTPTTGCASPRVRREDEKNRFIGAVQRLNNYDASNPTASRGSQFNQIAQMHVDYFDNAHGGPVFFPWHRWYLRDFERRLQQIDSSVTLPFWDSSADASSPELSPVLDDFGGNSRGRCLQTGPFRNWYVTTGGGHCLVRDYDLGNRISAFVAPEALSALIFSSRTMRQLAANLEPAPHGSVHVGIGGDMGQANSANDVLFWLHHANYDRIWWQWQQISPQNANDVSGVGNLVPANIPASAMLSTQSDSLCYTYTTPTSRKLLKRSSNNSTATTSSSSSAAPSATPAVSQQNIAGGDAPVKVPVSRDDSIPQTGCNPGDRANSTCTNYVRQLPDSFIKMHKLKVELVRNNEKFINTIVDGINAAGIVSVAKTRGSKRTWHMPNKASLFAQCEANPTFDKYLKKAQRDFLPRGY